MTTHKENIRKNKLLRGVDNCIWNRFVGYCKAHGVFTGDKLSEVLETFLKDKKF